MKDWIKNLNDEEIRRLYRDEGALAPVPAALRERVLAGVREQKTPESAPRAVRFPLKPAFAIAAAAIVIVAGVLLLGPLLAPGGETTVAADSADEKDLKDGFIGMAHDRAVVVYAAGTVDIGRADGFSPVKIGGFVGPGDRIRTGESSFCEIQVGDRAVVVVEERTELILEDLDTRPGAADIGFFTAAGGLLHKVNRLAGGESYRVRTPTAACGVRGTRFSTVASGGGETIVSVAEGSVYLLPGHPDTDALRRRGRKADRRIAERIGRLNAEAPGIDRGKEIVLSGDYLAATRNQAADLGSAIERTLSGETIAGPDLERLDRAAGVYLAKTKSVLPAVRPVASTRSLKLDWLDRLPLVPVSYRDTTVPSPSAAGPALVRIELKTEPPDAMIFLFGQPVGRGLFRGLAAEGVRFEFEVRREGYEDTSLTVNVSAEGEKTFTTSLKRLPKKPSPTAAAVSPSPAAVVRKTPPAPFTLLTEYGGNAYYLYPAAIGWHQAKTLCEKNGGHLVTITSAGENQALLRALHDARVKSDIWIGYTIAGKRSYSWITGEVSPFTYWEPGRPDNPGGNQEYVYMQNIPGEARWEDAPDDQDHWCILELEGAAGTASQMKKSAPFEFLLEFEGHRYYLSRETADWHTAKKACAQNGGHLATVTSGPENRAIIRALRPHRLDRYAWIGLTNEEDGIIWRWVTGEKLYYSYWDVTEPNNISGLEHWAAYWVIPRGDGSDADYHWLDLTKDEQNYFIMEIDPSVN